MNRISEGNRAAGRRRDTDIKNDRETGRNDRNKDKGQDRKKGI